MTDDALNSLKSLRAAQPSPEAKKLADAFHHHHAHP